LRQIEFAARPLLELASLPHRVNFRAVTATNRVPPKDAFAGYITPAADQIHFAQAERQTEIECSLYLEEEVVDLVAV